MLEIRFSFFSEEEWKSWRSTYQEQFAVWRGDVLSSVRANGLLEPITGIRRPPKGIEINEANLRGTISIQELNSRKRAALLCLDLERQNIGNKKSRINPKILGAEALSRVARILRGTFCYNLGAEYLPTKQDQESHFPVSHLDLCNLAFRDETFDLFYSGDVFEHLPDLARALREIARILKPGGVAVSTLRFHPGQSKTRIKARLTEGQIEHLEAPEYRRDPERPAAQSLIFSVPGWDILDLCKNAGFCDVRMTLVASSTFAVTSSGVPGVFVLIASKAAADDHSAVVTVPRRRGNLFYKGPPLQKIIGLLAVPRSGTTLLSSILGVHSDIRPVFEPWNANKNVELSNPVTLNNFFDVFPTAMEGKTTLLVKETATKSEYIERLTELLRSVETPVQRSMIVLFRNPLHVFLSEVEARRKWWGEGGLEHTVEVFNLWAARTIASVRRLLKLGAEFGAILVSYEALVTRKRATIQSLMDYLEIAFEEKQLRFELHIKRSEVRGDISIATDPIEISTSSMDRRAQEISTISTILEQSHYTDVVLKIVDVCTILEAEAAVRINTSVAQEIIRPLWNDLSGRPQLS
jgi:SAM-dependent methyltransferase